MSVPIKKLTIPRGVFNAVCYSNDGQYLAAIYSGWRVRIWSTLDFSDRFSAQLPGILYAHSSLQFAGDLAILSDNVYNFSAVWDALKQGGSIARPGKLIREMPLEHRDPMSRIEFLLVDKTIVRVHFLSNYRDLNLTFFDLAGHRLRSLTSPFCHFAPAITRDLDTALFYQEREAILIDLNTMKERTRLQHSAIVTKGVFSPDGRLLATRAGRSFWLWDLASGKGESFPSYKTNVEGITFHPDGTLLAASDRAGEIRLVDTTTWRQRTCLNFQVDGIHDLAFSPDGMTVAGAGHNAVIIWDVE